MARIQMFDTPHKALRFAFNQLLVLAGKTDFGRSADIHALSDEMKNVFSLVKSHSHHEDDICFADLDLIDPAATQHDRSEHTRLHERLDALSADLKNLAIRARSGSDESEAGRAFYADLCDLHAEMLVHMMEEERDTMPAFWKHMSDEQIAAFEPRILAAMTPDMSALWMRYIIPAQPVKALAGMFAGMRAEAPPFVFEGNMRLAASLLAPAEMEQLEAALEPVFA